MTTPPVDRPSPRWQRRKEARPGEILESALAEFVDRGFAATRLEDIARSAGVTKGTMYLYFENKEQLFQAVVREHVKPLLDEQEQMTAGHSGSQRDLLERVLRARWRGMFESRVSGLVKMMMSEARAFPELARWYHGEVIEPGQKLIARIVTEGIAKGEFRPGLDPLMVARHAAAPIVLAAVWKHSFMKLDCGMVDPAAYLDSWLGVLLDGLAVPATEGNR